MDAEVGAQLNSFGQLLLVSGGGNDGGVEELGNLNSGDAYARARRQNQNRIAGFDRTAAYEHVPGGGEYQGNAGSLLERKRHSLGNRNNANARHGDVFAVAAVIGVSENAEAGAEILASPYAFEAVSAEGHGRQQHALARLQIGDVLADPGHLAGNVAAVDVRQLDAGESL